MLILPFFLLRHLRLDRKAHIALVVTFALGLITIACAISRFAILQIYIDVDFGPICKSIFVLLCFFLVF